MRHTTATTPMARATGGLVVATLACSVLVPGAAASTGSDSPGISAHTSHDTLDQITARWRGYAGSSALDCLGPGSAQPAAKVVASAMRRGIAAALTEHVDPRAAAHAAARTGLVRFVRRSAATAPCRDRTERSLQRVYRAAMDGLPDRPTVWRGAALGNIAEHRPQLAGPRDDTSG